MSTTAPGPDFAQAARRHYDDAVFLRDNGRLPNADHHAGFAAECALKSILIGYLGGSLSAAGKPQWPSGNNATKHINLLWDEIALHAQGRNAASFATLLSSETPFSDWDVSDRYGACAHITEQVVNTHLTAARKTVEALETAEIDGNLA